MAVDGDQLLVGSPTHSAQGIREWGRAFYFERNGTGPWAETEVIIPPLMVDRAWASYSVALENDRAILGVYGDSTLAPSAGAVCVFERSAGAWQPATQMLAGNGHKFAHLGFSVQLQGGLLVSGAFRDGPYSDHFGQVHVWRDQAGTFQKIQALRPPGLEYGAAFGECVYLSAGGSLFASYPGGDNISGRLAEYRVNAQGRFRLANVYRPPGGEPLECFGWKVRTEGDRVVCTALTADVAGDTRGVVYLFNRSEVGSEYLFGQGSPSGGVRPVNLRSRGPLVVGNGDL